MRQMFFAKVTPTFLLSVPLVVFSCRTETLSGGLMLQIDQDGTLELDEIRVWVGDVDGKELADESYRGEDVQDLPKTVRIANGQPERDVMLRVSAWNTETPLDVRDLTVLDVPNDSVKTVTITLSAQCSDAVKLEGGQAVSKCELGQTCDPASGDCISSEVDGGDLPEFDESDEPSGTGGGNEDTSLEEDSGNEEDGSGGGSGDPLGSGGSDGTGGEPALVEELGEPCNKNGGVACDRNTLRQTLICEEGKWRSNGGCSTSEACDPGAGACAPILPECVGRNVGGYFCNGDELRACGINLVQSSVVERCEGLCEVVANSAQCSKCPEEWSNSGEDADIAGFERIYHDFDSCHSTIATTAMAGQICTEGTAAQVVDDMFSSMWGAGVGLQPIDDAAADLNAYMGFRYTIDDVPDGLRVGISVEGDSNLYFTEAVVAGENRVFFSQLSNGSWVDPPGVLDLSKVTDVRWEVASTDSAPIPFDFCLSDIQLAECTEVIAEDQFFSHQHELMVPPADVAAGTEKTYTLGSPNNGQEHTHTLTITADAFATLKKDGVIVVTSEVDESSHQHDLRITCSW